MYTIIAIIIIGIVIVIQYHNTQELFKKIKFLNEEYVRFDRDIRTLIELVGNKKYIDWFGERPSTGLYRDIERLEKYLGIEWKEGQPPKILVS